jgi:hypothetical protein
MLLSLTSVTRSNLVSILVVGYGHRMTTAELFPLTLADAGNRLSMSPDAVAELVRLGEIGAYLVAGRSGGPPPTLRFAPADLRAFQQRDDPTAARLTSTVAALLRRYLRGASPTPADVEAPMLAQARGGVVYAHIQLSAFQRWIQAMLVTLPGPTDPRVYLPDPLRMALRRLGCRSLQAIRPLHLSKMLWADWWRVPQSLWSLHLEELAPPGAVGVTGEIDPTGYRSPW